mmetsp:Transcript_5282/g.6743  ORF Transcript_5282/g.6743 Transcript_5282/m.6743 type:complete len:230 (+) Transcript_5282:55-744(+)
MIAIIPLSILLGPIIAGLGYLHVVREGGEIEINPLALSLIFFLPVNVLICFWELVLCYNIKFITKIHEKKKKEGFYTLPPAKQDPIVLFRDLPLSQLFCPDFWAYIWIDYCRFDAAYADPITFGFNIDVGNGHTTLIPSLLLLSSCFCSFLSARVMGMIGLVFCYQMFYGAAIYYYSYFNNAGVRTHTKDKWNGFGIVMFSNSLWILFPLLGMFVSYDFIMTDSFDIVR